jgi:hypothetical protein
LLVTAGDRLNVWHMDAGTSARGLPDLNEVTEPIALTADGQCCFSGRVQGGGRAWWIDGSLPPVEFGRSGSLGALTVTSIGDEVLFARRGGADVELWNRLIAAANPRQLTGHVGVACSLAISVGAGFVAAGTTGGRLHVWELDWEMDFLDAANWHMGASRIVNTFLLAHTPWPSTELRYASWSERDFAQLLYDLEDAGFGWLRPDGVAARLARLVEAQM